jgi:hypothetical protein
MTTDATPPPPVEILYRDWQNAEQPMVQIQQVAGHLDVKQFLAVQQWIKTAFVAGSGLTAEAIKTHAFDPGD